MDNPLCIQGVRHLEDRKICLSKMLYKTLLLNHPFLGFYLVAWNKGFPNIQPPSSTLVLLSFSQCFDVSEGKESLLTLVIN